MSGGGGDRGGGRGEEDTPLLPASLSSVMSTSLDPPYPISGIEAVSLPIPEATDNTVMEFQVGPTPDISMIRMVKMECGSEEYSSGIQINNLRMASSRPVTPGYKVTVQGNVTTIDLVGSDSGDDSDERKEDEGGVGGGRRRFEPSAKRPRQS